MRIGSIDISTYNAKQRTVSFYEHNAVSGDSEWLPGAAIPYFSSLQIGMKKFTVSLWVYGSSREEINLNCSNIIASLLKPVELTLDGYEHKFRGVMTGHKEKEGTSGAMKRWHILEISFQGYEDSDPVTESGYSSVQVTNPGNIVSPAILEITPRVGASSISLTGICRDHYTEADLPVTIENLTAGNTVRIDTMTGLITENGMPKEVDMWTMPSLVPGNNTITCDNAEMGISITVTPLYM